MESLDQPETFVHKLSFSIIVCVCVCVCVMHRSEHTVVIIIVWCLLCGVSNDQGSQWANELFTMRRAGTNQKI